MKTLCMYTNNITHELIKFKTEKQSLKQNNSSIHSSYCYLLLVNIVILIEANKRY